MLCFLPCNIKYPCGELMPFGIPFVSLFNVCVGTYYLVTCRLCDKLYEIL